MRIHHVLAGLLALSAGLGPAACGPEGSEPALVSLAVVAAPDGIATCTNDLGWQVVLDEARVAVADLEFTIEGEIHAARTAPVVLRGARRLAALLVSAAHAHPGHQAGGEVTGTLDGDLLADLVHGADLGIATLLEGDYHGVNLAFRRAGAADGLAQGDPLAGHTAVLSGTATKGDATVTFQAVLDIEDGLRMVGGPFDLAVRPETAVTLRLTLFTIDPSENDTLFDGLDFGALDGDADGVVTIVSGQAAHNVLAKTLVRHDHWGVVVR
jgi:hypothetical protein